MSLGSARLTRSIGAAAVFGGLSFVLDALTAPYLPRVPGWGIGFIDPVSIIWVTSYLLFGLIVGVSTSVIGTLGLMFFDPFTPVGPIMKFLATPLGAAPLGGPVPKQPADIEDRTLSVGPKGEVRIRIVRPKGNKSPLPVLIYCHGGGWVLGSKDTHDRLVRDLANGAQAAVVFGDYDRSPEAKYPVAIEESYAVAKSVSENPKLFNVDASRIAVAGDSVGGNMAAAVTILAKERGGPRIIQQIMFYPVTDANFHNGSYEQFAEGYFLTREAMKWFWNSYLPDEVARRQPTASPLQATIEQLKGLPPALITTNENDVLRDEAEDYAHKLAQAGVPVAAVRFLGLIHDNLILGAITQTPGARAATALAIAHLQKAFNQ